MKNIRLIIMVMGFTVINAYASNEMMDTAESDAKAEAESMKDEQSAAMDENKAEAEADVDATKAEMEEGADEVAEQVEEEVKAEAEAVSEYDGSGNLVSTCTNGDVVRVISVVYDNAETDTVCEVTYEKSTGIQTLWSANTERDYCLDQATAFVEKQRGWGWTCSNLE